MRLGGDEHPGGADGAAFQFTLLRIGLTVAFIIPICLLAEWLIKRGGGTAGDPAVEDLTTA